MQLYALRKIAERYLDRIQDQKTFFEKIDVQRKAALLELHKLRLDW